MAEPCALPSRQKPENNLPDDERRQNLAFNRRVEQHNRSSAAAKLSNVIAGAHQCHCCRLAAAHVDTIAQIVFAQQLRDEREEETQSKKIQKFTHFRTYLAQF